MNNHFTSPYPSGFFSPSSKAPQFKVIFVGNSGVGKTCVVVREAKDLY
jgi:GTPase SAR1 family protein